MHKIYKIHHFTPYIGLPKCVGNFSLLIKRLCHRHQIFVLQGHSKILHRFNTNSGAQVRKDSSDLAA
jgi:hypothetical protein